ncbi:retinoic acid receptor responder protein 1 isoform X2 [Erinaceus europaeus]|uniref:Retinoic acid receptor responder protein 1 isoform X2 n=1 Tax=Erinaceus europaeus TaxID=9365 RepID=A0ABM3XXM2_ERIEU|nr:retinoic acid receptor responder protein 1 isoform X2 [Erinaceus europaeus]
MRAAAAAVVVCPPGRGADPALQCLRLGPEGEATRVPEVVGVDGSALLQLPLCLAHHAEAAAHRDELNRVNREKKFAAGVAFTAGAYHMTKEKKYTGNCLTSVTFKSKVLAPDVIVSCQVLMNKLKGERDDHLLFKNLSKTLPIPGQVVAIPASKENMNTSLVPILDLALLGSSYVMWNRTTLSSYFSFERLSAVSHWEVKDEEVHFDYLALIRELSTQEIVPCLVHMIWYPIKTLKIEYHCSDIQKKQH